MGEITFSARLINREGSTLQLFIREYWLAKKLLNNSALSLHLVMYLFCFSTGQSTYQSFYASNTFLC